MEKQSAVLASDMDGTFIPLDGSDENRRDLATLAQELGSTDVELLYVTGRHYELAIEAVREFHLPIPSWLICDVGTSIYRRAADHDFQLEEAYSRCLAEIVGDIDVEQLSSCLADLAGLTLQAPEKQGRFKLSYDCDAQRLEELTERILEKLDRFAAPYRLIGSVDPFTGGGLIDLLPQDCSKAYALAWWVIEHGRPAEAIMFAGDSGNDLAALSAGYRSIVVGNASASVVDQVQAAHQAAGWHDRLFVASKPATSGVLQGFRHFRGRSDAS